MDADSKKFGVVEDISWWWLVNLRKIDDTFAIAAPAFKAYVAGLGVTG